MKIGKNIFAPRILAVLTALLLACLCVIPAGATQKYKWVDDRNDLIGENCEKEIEASFEYIKNTYDYNVYYATVYSLGSKTATEYADDLYDSLFPINSTGILMLVSMEERDYAFSTSGAAIDLFNTDSRLTNLELAVVALLRVNDFEGAAKTFAHLTQSCLEAVRRYEQDKDDIPNAWMNSYCETIDDYWVKRKMPEEYNSVSLRGIIKALSESHENTGGIYDYGRDYLKRCASRFLIALAVAAVVAFIWVGVMKSKMNTARRQNAASNYVRPDSFKLTQSSDLFLYSTVSRTARARDDSSGSGGGGGGSHTSSSGGSHGGSSGKF